LTTTNLNFKVKNGLDASGVVTSTGLSLLSTTSPITLNGSTGTSGQILTSAGTGATPTWASSFSGFLSTTNTGRTGSVSFITPGSSSQATWANYPVGLGTMVNANQGSNGAPNNNYHYFFKVANRDFGGGWGGISIDYATGDFFVGRANESSNYATWHRLANTSLANAFTVGGHSITSEGTAVIPLFIRGASGQTANLTEWQNNTPSTIALVTSGGSIFSSANGGFGSTSALGTARLSVSAAASSVGVIVRANATTPGNLQEWQDSSAGVHSGILPSGFLFVGGSSSAGGQIGITAEAATNRGMVIKGAASQTADLVQYQNSSSTILGGINGANQIFTGSTTPILTASGGTIQSIASGANPLVTMASAHGFTTGDLVTLAGTTGGTYNGTFVVASTPASTTFTITSALTAGQAGTGGTASDPAQLSVTARSAGTVGAVIRGASGQTADLLQIQNSSGTPLSYFDSTGTPVAPAYAHTSGAFRLFQASGGGVLQITKATSAVANVGADVGRLYLRDGTTAGTTKLAIRTGASGVEETIIDNLSSTGSTAGGQFVGAGGINTAGALITSSSITTGGALNLNYASPTIASNNASAASIFTGTVTGVTIGSSTIRTTAFPADGTTSTATAGAGYMGLPQNATTTGSYTIVAADAGKHIYASATRTVTIPANGSVAFPVGTTITFIAGSGATMTIAITTDTMYLAGPGTTGSRTLAAFGMATAVKITSTSWIISGNGLT